MRSTRVINPESFMERQVASLSNITFYSRKQINQRICSNGTLWPTEKSAIFLVARRNVCSTTLETARLGGYYSIADTFVHIRTNINLLILWEIIKKENQNCLYPTNIPVVYSAIYIEAIYRLNFTTFFLVSWEAISHGSRQPQRSEDGFEQERMSFAAGNSVQQKVWQFLRRWRK